MIIDYVMCEIQLDITINYELDGRGNVHELIEDCLLIVMHLNPIVEIE